MANKLEPMIQAKIKKDIDSATGGDLTNYYTKTESDDKFALKSTVTTLEGVVDTLGDDVDTIEENLTDYIVSKEVTIIGIGAGTAITIGANAGAWVDCSTYIDADAPTGYKAIKPYLMQPSFINTSNVYALCSGADGRIRVVNRTATDEPLQSFRVIATYIRDI